MPKFVNLTGQLFGKYKVIRHLGNRRWLCICSGCKKVYNLNQSSVVYNNYGCRTCWSEYRRNKANRFCTVLGCNKPYMALGYCVSHYDKFRKYGNALTVKRVINLPIGTEVETSDGYLKVKLPGNRLASRSGWVMKSKLMYEIHNKVVLDPSEHVYFVNGDKKDCSKDNLVLKKCRRIVRCSYCGESIVRSIRSNWRNYRCKTCNVKTGKRLPDRPCEVEVKVKCSACGKQLARQRYRIPYNKSGLFICSNKCRRIVCSYLMIERKVSIDKWVKVLNSRITRAKGGSNHEIRAEYWTGSDSSFACMIRGSSYSYIPFKKEGQTNEDFILEAETFKTEILNGEDRRGGMGGCKVSQRGCCGKLLGRIGFSEST